MKNNDVYITVGAPLAAPVERESIMNHMGTQKLETERLILRRYVLDDAPAMYANWASDPEVTRYLTWPVHTSVDVTRAVISDWEKQYERPDVYHWGLVLKETGELIGDIALVRVDDAIEEGELGWCMGRAWWGRGLMPEAGRAVLDYLFDAVGFNRVMAKHDVNNPKSGRAMQKIGMLYEGTQRQAGRNNQGLIDNALYAILKSDKGRHA